MMGNEYAAVHHQKAKQHVKMLRLKSYERHERDFVEHNHVEEHSRAYLVVKLGTHKVNHSHGRDYNDKCCRHHSVLVKYGVIGRGKCLKRKPEAVNLCCRAVQQKACLAQHNGNGQSQKRCNKRFGGHGPQLNKHEKQEQRCKI